MKQAQKDVGNAQPSGGESRGEEAVCHEISLSEH